MASAEQLKTLGRYNIERVLGKGAMGVVYEGVDPRLGRRVAIKTILKSALDEDTGKDFAMRFVREAQAVARLNHPNVVQVFDFGEEGDVAYIVMEFIRGKELKNFFDANERFDLKEAVRIMCELCEALDFAHEAGIVHRDIKPANVMLDSQGRTKLTDFGVARVQDNDKTSVEKTQAGTMVGTPAYMSPEQITGGNIDRRTDVFSAGIILYQFLTGEKPFTGSGAWTIAKKIIQEDPPLPSSLNNAITPVFDAVVNKALAKNVDERFQTARDLGAALKRALEGKGLEDDSDKTVVGGGIIDLDATMKGPAPIMPNPAAAAKSPTATASAGTQQGSQEVELEFWRAIKDGNDPDDFELYVQQFPTGIYAALAKRKIAKLKGVTAPEDSKATAEQEKREAAEAAAREADARRKLAEEK
ncbi:MAG TPA: serine/threonine-protein kinase, partial [Reyranella sp.]|nr:serine/threonine-protein kinase [Reyranella sp.]